MNLSLPGAAMIACLTLVTPAAVGGPHVTACSPTVLESPRTGANEVQVKALNDRGDVVGFSDGADGTFRAILWKRGKAAGAVELGVPPGYVSSEAYGVNDDRVVYGVLYDKQKRTFPFRWERGRMTLLRDPDERIQPVLLHDPTKNAINNRGEIVATMMVGGRLRAVRWAPDGRATFLPALPGHTFTWGDSVNDKGVVSGWSRKRPRMHDVESPVIWTKSGQVVGLRTLRGASDGYANASGSVIVGVLGTPTGAERDQAAIWRTPTAKPLLLGAATPHAYAELLDVNDRGEAIGAQGTFGTKGFVHARGVIWRRGWTRLRPIPVPAEARVDRVVLTGLDDINNQGAIVGNVYGLTAPAYDKLRRITPVLWACQFGR
jgi:uncharacterized membrane protein